MKELNIKSRLHNEADVLEVDDKSLSEAVIPFIEADKDIISKIKVEYDSDNGSTYFTFPIGIIPLSITLNTHQLFFKEDVCVDYTGQAVEGYNLEEFEFNKDDCYLGFADDLSEQIINGLVYINYQNTIDKSIFSNSYYLFYPVTTAGTKLYSHAINSLMMTIVSINSEKYTNYAGIKNDYEAGKVVLILKYTPGVGSCQITNVGMTGITYYNTNTQAFVTESITGTISDVVTAL